VSGSGDDDRISGIGQVVIEASIKSMELQRVDQREALNQKIRVVYATGPTGKWSELNKQILNSNA